MTVDHDATADHQPNEVNITDSLDNASQSNTDIDNDVSSQDSSAELSSSAASSEQSSTLMPPPSQSSSSSQNWSTVKPRRKSKSGASKSDSQRSRSRTPLRDTAPRKSSCSPPPDSAQ